MVRNACVQPTASSAIIQTHVALAPPVSFRTIRRRLAEGHLRSRRPLRVLPLTPTHRRLHLEWCRARETRRLIQIQSQQVTRLVDADITGKWFEAALEVSNLCTSYSDNTLQPLGIQHIYGVLVLWAAGLTMSFIVLLFERNLFRYKNNNTDIRVNKI
ncbi:lig_chan-Glu_bd domain-containing protein [Trichonephila clavipes]|nr:lig_chan-Glu_bd domain-containing protein [Trichonephila clavipes]